MIRKKYIKKYLFYFICVKLIIIFKDFNFCKWYVYLYLDCDIVLDGDEFMRQHTEVKTTLIASEEITKLINLPNQEKGLK